MAYDVSIAPCGTYEAQEVENALRKAIDGAGGLDMIRPGMTVALKVNLVRGQRPEAASTVHPEVVCALTRILKERGAEVVIGDSPGGVFTATYVGAVYAFTGMRQAEKEGARLNDDFTVTEADFPEAKKAKQFPCTAWLTKADAVIDVCKLKTHGMMGMSNAVKNLFGSIPGTTKPEFHYTYPRAEDFADVLVDLYEYFRPVLCICDAVIGMEGNGPTMGDPRKIGCVMAAGSGHAMDLVGAEIIGMKPETVPTLRAAMDRGLVPRKLSGLSVDGDPLSYRPEGSKTVTPQSSVFFHILGDGPLGKAADFLAGRVFTPFPKPEPELCIGCGKCAQTCPAKAITMQDDKPQIDRRTCIHCFCCQEFCPKGAIKVGKGFLLKLLG